MKFKSQEGVKQETTTNKLFDGLVDLINFEIDKKVLIYSSIFYFENNGRNDYKKFFKYLNNICEDNKNCLIHFTKEHFGKIPSMVFGEIKDDFANILEPFKQLSEMEDTYEQKLNNLINLAFDEKDWSTFHYLLNKLSEMEHICCKALATIENKGNILDLCEQHTMDD